MKGDSIEKYAIQTLYFIKVAGVFELFKYNGVENSTFV